jgi:Ca2+-binding EF-hand superfamily protein
MHRRLIALIAPFVLVSAIAGSASARTAPQDGTGPAMQGLPRTAEEVRPWTERLFARLDANQDGALVDAELAVLDTPAGGGGGARFRGMILRADADADARITLEELVGGTQRMFERMNGGGRAGGPGPGMGGPGMGGPGMGGGGMMALPRTSDGVGPWAERLFTRLDANQDAAITGDELAILANPTVAAMGGSRLRAMIVQSDASRDSRINLEELSAGAQRMFSRMDVNGDGRLSDEELPRRPAPPPSMAIPPPASTMPTFPDNPPDGG